MSDTYSHPHPMRSAFTKPLTPEEVAEFWESVTPTDTSPIQVQEPPC